MLEKIEIPEKKDYISLNESLEKLNESVICQFNAKVLKGITNYNLLIFLFCNKNVNILQRFKNVG